MEHLKQYIFDTYEAGYLVSRDFQDMFVSYLEDMGFDYYGSIEDQRLRPYEVELKSKSKYTQDFVLFENDTFIIMPFYWDEDDFICSLPNFVYKPTGFSLSWYKYPLRGSYSNRPVTREELESMLIECKKSIHPEIVKMRKKERLDRELKKLDLNSTLYVKLNEKGKSILHSSGEDDNYRPDELGLYQFTIKDFFRLFDWCIIDSNKSVTEDDSIFIYRRDLKDRPLSK